MVQDLHCTAQNKINSIPPSVRVFEIPWSLGGTTYLANSYHYIVQETDIWITRQAWQTIVWKFSRENLIPLLKQASVSAPVESKEKQNIIYLKKALIFQFLYLQQIEDNPAKIGDFQTKQLLRAGSALPILWSTWKLTEALPHNCQVGGLQMCRLSQPQTS